MGVTFSVASSVGAPDGSALTGAASWIEGALLGSVGTSIAVIAVAWLGFLMLRGRSPVRRGATVLLGCFILFGAAAIARGLVGLTGPDTTEAPIVVQPVPPSATLTPPVRDDASAPPDDNADPYFGTAAPQ